MERLYQAFAFNEAEPLIFTQLDFWLFFLAVMIIFSMIHKNFLVRSFFLTVISLFFYFKTSGLYVLLLGLSLIVNYLLGNAIFKSRSETGKKWIIAASSIFNLSMLGYFKYAYFFTESYNKMFQTDYQVFNQLAVWGNGFFGEGTFVEQIILPVGVSFFTFQSISYVVDIYRKEVEPVRNFFDYTFFVTFFPQLVAGPIVRARDFIPQIRQPFQLDKNDFSWAIIQIVKGLIKKIVLADYIAVHFIDKVADAPEAYPGFVSILAMWGYSLQIYGDFSGYTDIAIGVSRLMGFKLLENFNSPYKAVSVADFWRRWHKSLGSWLRDYLYIPLGGNKSGGIGTYVATLIILIFLVFITQWYELIFVYLGLMTIYIIGVLIIPNFKQYVHRDLNLLITMVVGGLWHGASENFVIWGAMNGAALVIYNYWKKFSPYENKGNLFIVHFWKIFITFNFITFTRIWFRLEEDGQPLVMLDQIWNHFNFTWDTFVLVLSTYQSVFWVMLGGYIVHWLPQTVKDKWQEWFTNTPMVLQAVSVAIIVVLMYQAVSDTFKPFVYFQF
ncbi:MAG: MBOAT family protein [Bacteroidetes bacterium]|nr:MAG: MBOAT family protein [Bacteroidota bacterium]